MHNDEDLPLEERIAVATEQTAANTDPVTMAEVVGPALESDRQALGEREALVVRAETQRDARKVLAAGQARINSVWEYSQAIIALTVVITTSVAIFMARTLDLGPASADAFPPEWWTIVGLVIGFYFGRTNHSRAGDGQKGDD